MRKINRKEDCFGCGACAAACKAGAISMREDREGFLYPTIDERRCIDCGACDDVCPAKEALARTEGEFYAVRCRDEALLRKSTSGGAFSLLAGEVIKSGGVVCGAVFDKKFRVTHILSEDFAPMRKSKYVQSDMSSCFEAIRQTLEGGRKVLFSGTPCQCHALRRFIGKQASELYLAALVCRGVQSPGLWADYVAYLSQNGVLEAYDFRDKRVLNNGHTTVYKINGQETVLANGQDRFGRLYTRCLTLRPSCYECPYCSPANDFDFVLGDFWGAEKTLPEMVDGKGVSLVVVKGEKAKALFSGISADAARIIPCKREDTLQPALQSPAKQTLLRKLLFNDYARKDADGHCDMALLLKKYAAG